MKIFLLLAILLGVLLGTANANSFEVPGELSILGQAAQISVIADTSEVEGVSNIIDMEISARTMDKLRRCKGQNYTGYSIIMRQNADLGKVYLDHSLYDKSIV
jgi:hypothetical protein